MNNSERYRKNRMAYYKNENYRSEAEMKREEGMSDADKAAQRELNWDIRLEHYAVKNPGQFVKMTDEWAKSFGFPSPGVPTMKLLYILKLARQNGIASNTIIQFAGAEERLLKERPGFASPAAVPFNGDKYDANCRAAVPGMMPASSSIVGKKSVLNTGSRQTSPAFVMPGIRTISGTRIPPSYSQPFPDRSGKLHVGPSFRSVQRPPLSEVKMIVVESSSPCS